MFIFVGLKILFLESDPPLSLVLCPQNAKGSLTNHCSTPNSCQTDQQVSLQLFPSFLPFS